MDKMLEKSEILMQQFLTFFYKNNPAPNEILVNLDLKETKLIQKVISPTKSVEIRTPKKGKKLELLKIVGENITKKYLEMAINSMANIPERSFREILKCLITFDRYGDIEKISSPCCLLAGNNDMNAPSKTMKKMSEKIKNSEFYSFDNVGHLINIEIPEETNKVIFKFYESLNT